MPTAPSSVEPESGGALPAGAGDAGEALDRLEAGGLVAFPTETVWGLAALARSAESVAALRAWKGREEDHPLSVLVTGPEAVEALGYALGAAGRALAARCWPGPLTLVARATSRAAPFAPGVARKDGAVGFRCSPHPAARALAREALARGAGPPTATSLNRSGDRPAASRAEACALCQGPGAPWPWPEGGLDAGGGAPSSVVDVTGPRPVVLRTGALSARDIRDIADRAASAAAASTEEQPDR